MDLIVGSAREELCKRVIDSLSQLKATAKDVLLERNSYQEFSTHISQLQTLLQLLQSPPGPAGAADPTRAALLTLEEDVSKACRSMDRYKSGSSIRRLFNSQSILNQLRRTAKDMATSVQLFDLANLNSALHLQSRAAEIVNGLESLHFTSAAATEAIVSQVEETIAHRGRAPDYRADLLSKIAEAVGARPDASMVRREIARLREEKEELEEQKQHAEALQLSQLIQFLCDNDDSEMARSPSRSGEATSVQSSWTTMMSSFSCPLSGELMEDPVAVLCGHSFERKAIADYFGRGGQLRSCCPACGEQLPSLELTANISLRSSIQEWKQRESELKLQTAVSGILSDNPELLNPALEDLQAAMEMAPSCIAQVMKRGLVPKLVVLLRSNLASNKVLLRCLRLLVHYSQENKEVIARKGGIRCIVKQFCRGETEPEAVEILLELSRTDALAEEIGQTKDSILSLVSLLRNTSPDVSQKALEVLGNLSSNTHFVIKMAEAGHFEPYLDRFHQGHSETKAAMAKALTMMQLPESAARLFENEQFISALTKMLYSISPACKSASLRCIRKLSAFHGLRLRLLADRDTVPGLLGLVTSSVSSEPLWKQEATEILISLVKASHPSDYQTNPSLQELHSEHNIQVFLSQATSSIPQAKASSLRLLQAMVQRSDAAKELIRSNHSAMTCLFSTLKGDYHQSNVRLQAMNLICCIAEGDQNGIPLPASPAKESLVTSLIEILTSSPNEEERSAAARLIGQLPTDDTKVDQILHNSEALKAIHEVISATDDRHRGGMTKEPLQSIGTTSDELLENALSALLRFTEPTKPELQRQVTKLELYPCLVHVLSRGSSLAKQRTALVLARLSTSFHPTTNNKAIKEGQGSSSIYPLLMLLNGKMWCCLTSQALQQSTCGIHGSACSSHQSFCLIKANAVQPLVQTLGETESGASEAALMALDTLFSNGNPSSAASAIVESQGLGAILGVLEKGSLPAKVKALDLFQKIFEHSMGIPTAQLQRSKGILIHLLKDDDLKKKAAVVLSQMAVLPHQSSYF